MIVFGDIAGNYDALMRLVEQVPKDTDLIFLGDLCDRGSKSKEVIEWVKTHAKESLMGNHEDMMLDFFNDTRLYENGTWYYNGGFATVKSYFPDVTYDDSFNLPKTPDKYPTILKEHLAWVAKRPITHETSTLFLSHAPYDETKPIMDKLWNRKPPFQTDKFQIYGHNGFLKRHYGAIKEEYAICIDNTRNGMLTAIDTETDIIYREPYR